MPVGSKRAKCSWRVRLLVMVSRSGSGLRTRGHRIDPVGAHGPRRTRQRWRFPPGITNRTDDRSAVRSDRLPYVHRLRCLHRHSAARRAEMALRNIAASHSAWADLVGRQLAEGRVLRRLARLSSPTRSRAPVGESPHLSTNSAHDLLDANSWRGGHSWSLGQVAVR